MASKPSGRKCVFCGATPTSNEHVFPDWMRRWDWLLEFLGPGRWGQSRSDLLDWQDVRQPPGGSILDMTVKRVCAPCNNEWMSDLDNAVKPIVQPLMRGEQATLDKAAQRTLSGWITKVDLMAEFTDPRTATASSDDYDYFYKWRGERAVRRTQMWIWSLDAGDDWRFRYVHQSLGIGATVEPPEKPNTRWSVYAFAHLGVAVAASPRQIKFEPPSVFMGRLARIRLSVGPVEFPPGNALGSEDMYSLVASGTPPNAQPVPRNIS